MPRLKDLPRTGRVVDLGRGRVVIEIGERRRMTKRNPEGVVERIKRSMGPLEKLAALKVWWWAQREVPKMFREWMRNAKVAWVTSLVGAIAVSVAGACAVHHGVAGDEAAQAVDAVFSRETCTMLMPWITALTGFLNVIGAGPAGIQRLSRG